MIIGEFVPTDILDWMQVIVFIENLPVDGNGPVDPGPDSLAAKLYTSDDNFKDEESIKIIKEIQNPNTALDDKIAIVRDNMDEIDGWLTSYCSSMNIARIKPGESVQAYNNSNGYMNIVPAFPKSDYLIDVAHYDGDGEIGYFYTYFKPTKCDDIALNTVRLNKGDKLIIKGEKNMLMKIEGSCYINNIPRSTNTYFTKKVRPGELVEIVAREDNLIVYSGKELFHPVIKAKSSN